MSVSGTEQSNTNGLIPPVAISVAAPPEDFHHVEVSAATLPTKLSKGKEKEWTVVDERKRPLRLLDLPVDILQEIIENLPHTNDLTALALCHSVLHSLCIPQIYSRFDIVWPDSQPNIEPRSGVDALTYGLATLVMADDAFGEAPHQTQSTQPTRMVRDPYGNLVEIPAPPKRRRGNNYAQYTKKFSLGDGPEDWTSEYLITKECGKMLGTLVALAVARMRNLEAFIWDMPTGVLRDIWLALSSLADRNDGKDCRLERVWIRWHNNFPATGLPPPPQVMNLPPPQNSSVPVGTGPTQNALPVQQTPVPLAQASHNYGYLDDLVEHPTFSILPPLKSLTVLDIDELSYLDEMSILIGRSQNQLKELRVGVAKHAVSRHWASVWEGDGIHQVDHSTTWQCEPSLGSIGKGVGIPEKRLGGVLGVLVGRVFNLRNNDALYAQAKREEFPNEMAALAKFKSLAKKLGFEESIQKTTKVPEASMHSAASSTGSSSSSNTFLQSISKFIKQSTEDGSSDASATLDALREFYRAATNAGVADQVALERSLLSRISGPCLNNSLKLEILELERVSISLTVVQKAIDWSTLTSLTLLNCQGHENLFKALRRHFTPTRSRLSSPDPFTGTGGGNGTTRSGPYQRSSASSNAFSFRADGDSSPSDYPLNIKRIHCNTVTAALLSFIRDTLAPNSLEVLFLQDSRHYNSSVPFIPIFTAIRRHARSLRKLLIDSSDQSSDDGHIPMQHNVPNPPPPAIPPPAVGPPVHQHGPGVVVQINVPANQHVAVNAPPAIPPQAAIPHPGNQQFRRWLLPRRFLSYMTSGAMSNLREFGGCIDYGDWHLFLQRLPGLKGLRSLYVPHIADHPAGPGIDGRELAMQVLDVVALRPEVEIVFVGIANKCFEVLEEKTPVPHPPAGPPRDTIPGQSEGSGKTSKDFSSTNAEEAVGGASNNVGVGHTPPIAHNATESSSGPSNGAVVTPPPASDVSGTESDSADDMETEDEDEETADDNEQELDIDYDALDGVGADGLGYVHRSDEEWDEFDEDWDYSEGKGRLRLRLREILYYDDKVAIFRARHAKL
ncbi:hypothetical protein P152DRAFT_347599 [Eremomyces bilateralis CBS 781.70]|uniref:F-box domain-containing protein n=1 Tax=Eremomyces bilateralis CBS 781.70 TaxID=1392243 RepID=A0A6G1G479_9PEZI|nr:uncharacterized protein P152DRAFT_347599 [Eremomyces bilateralis CBS 781.70]KAF1812720.1 hypothetical protein P152DRAFT_347599 [Eremomyces bilateralis CBS 781.70]